MNFDLSDKLNEYLKTNQLDTAIQTAENELRQLFVSPFHEILDTNLLHLSADLENYINEFHKKSTAFLNGDTTSFLNSIFKAANPKSSLQTIYCEMNDFTINYDRWFIDLFAYPHKGDLEDLDWTSDFQYSSENSLTITGFEHLQSAYQDYIENEKWKDGQLEACSDVCELLIILRLQELFASTFHLAKSNHSPWVITPVYITAHDYDLIYRTID